MDPLVLLLLALPVLLLAAGFLLALRAISSGGTGGHTADGLEILWSEPFARLIRDAEQPPGPGNLLLTREGLRFERYLSRRTLEIGWEELAEGGPHGREGERTVVFRRAEGESAFRLRDPAALLRALGEARGAS